MRLPRRPAFAVLALPLAAAAARADDGTAIGRWQYSQRSEAGGIFATAVLPGEDAGSKLILQCIPSAESKDLFLAVGAERAMDFKTKGAGTIVVDQDPPTEAHWAFLEKLIILNETDKPGYNADLMRRLATASTLKVSTPAADGSTFTAHFVLDRVADVVTRLFGACAVE
jgi:hypothetical protein